MADLTSVGVLVLQGGILAILLVALRRRDFAAAVNALVSFAATALPILVEGVGSYAFDLGITIGPELPLWIAVSGFLHSFGMLGPYDSLWWWDTLTHVVSAALVAALLYAGLLVGGQYGSVALSSGSVVVLTVLLTFAAGVFWELIELVARDVGKRYDVEPVLVHYGWRDTALDLVFDVVGAALVLFLDVQTFVPIAEHSPRTTTVLVLGSAGVFIVGSGALALAVRYGNNSNR